MLVNHIQISRSTQLHYLFLIPIEFKSHVQVPMVRLSFSTIGFRESIKLFDSSLFSILASNSIYLWAKSCGYRSFRSAADKSSAIGLYTLWSDEKFRIKNFSLHSDEPRKNFYKFDLKNSSVGSRDLFNIFSEPLLKRRTLSFCIAWLLDS